MLQRFCFLIALVFLIFPGCDHSRSSSGRKTAATDYASNEKVKTANFIQVENPLPNMDVTSPLTIKGKARGNWYFEGGFLVELNDAYDNKLAEKQVKADGEWMTEEFVPFEATLTFNAPDDQRGQLIFHKANPSGLPENAMEYSLPVIFPPK